MHSHAGIHAVTTASAATRASRPRWIDCACAQDAKVGGRLRSSHQHRNAFPSAKCAQAHRDQRPSKPPNPPSFRDQCQYPREKRGGFSHVALRQVNLYNLADTLLEAPKSPPQFCAVCSSLQQFCAVYAVCAPDPAVWRSLNMQPRGPPVGPEHLPPVTTPERG